MNIAPGKIQTLHLPLHDIPNGKLYEILPFSFDFINECLKQQGCMLVHCRGGVSRSASVVAAFMMNHFGLDLNTVLKSMKEKRPCVSPNFGFMFRLKSVERIYCKNENMLDSMNLEEYWSKHWHDYDLVKHFTSNQLNELFSLEGDFDDNLELLLKNQSK